VARENHPRSRRARHLARKQGQRPPHDRILIICEGQKTERLYLDAIRQQYSIPSSRVKVLPSDLGTEPSQVVHFAKNKFLETRAYEWVFAVFDRDDHRTYHDALNHAAALDRQQKNDGGNKIRFVAVPSVPCFELWLLLHFEDVQAFSHRTEMVKRLKQHIPNYRKGSPGIFALTEPNLDVAIERARHLRRRFNPREATNPFTGMDELVVRLRDMQRP